MITIALITFYSGMRANSPFQYLVYAFYVLGIIWAISAYRRSANYTGKFWDSFNQGFHCFVVVTLIMVAFTFTFSKMHPEFAEESAKAYKEQLVKSKTKLPAQIEEEITRYKKGYTTMLVYSSIFGYLIIGATVTAVVSVFNTRRK